MFHYVYSHDLPMQKNYCAMMNLHYICVFFFVSNAGAKEELTGPVRKRARTSRTGTIGPMGSPGEASSSSAEKSAKAKKRSGTLKIRRKSLDKEGNTEIQPPSPVEERKP
jgi:hypothetical protein